MRGFYIHPENTRRSSATEERLLQVLKALATSSKRALSIGALAQRAGYKDVKQLRRDLKTLKERGLVEIYWSGFPSDRQAHRRIAILAADLITVDTSAIEDEENEETEMVVSLPTPSYRMDTAFSESASINLPTSVYCLIGVYVKYVLERKMRAAEAILDRIKRRLPKGEFFEGVLLGLEGFKNSMVDDASTFFNSLNGNCDFRQVSRDFMAEFKKPSHTLYDRGYFYSLVLCTRVMFKMAELVREFPKSTPNLPAIREEASIEEDFEGE
jgi:hypothetical protein